MGEEGFAETFNSKYLFINQMNNKYYANCLSNLILNLEMNPQCSVAVGRKRAQSRRMQGKKSVEFICSFNYIIRLAQVFDLELKNNIWDVIYGAGGFLPIIPSNCPLIFRCSDVLNNNTRQWFLNKMKQQITGKAGLIAANVGKVDQQLLAYSTIFHSNSHDSNNNNNNNSTFIGTKLMSYEPSAIFYYPPESSLDNLIKQRQRWINSITASMIYLLFNQKQLFWQWQSNAMRKFSIWFLLCFNFFQITLIIISPSISFLALRTSINYLIAFFNNRSVKFLF